MNPNATTITYARMTNDRVSGPATGRNRSKMEPKLNWARLANNNMAAISAVVRPTEVAEVRWVATPQKTTPMTAPPPDEIIRAMAFCTNRPGFLRPLSESEKERLVKFSPFQDCHTSDSIAFSTRYAEAVCNTLLTSTIWTTLTRLIRFVHFPCSLASATSTNQRLTPRTTAPQSHDRSASQQCRESRMPHVVTWRVRRGGGVNQ